MIGRKNIGRSCQRHGSVLATCLMVWVLSWGCASTGSKVSTQVWSCDKKADAAVEEQNWDQALLRHRLLLQKEPGNCLVIYHLGYIIGRTGDRLGEAAHYEQAIQCGLGRDDRLYFNLGMAYADLNQLDKSLASFEKAISIDPQNPDNHFGLGLTAQAAGLTEQALGALRRAVDVNPRHWESRTLLTRILLDHGKLDDARIHLDALKDANVTNEDVEELRQIYDDRRVSTYDP